MPYQQPQEHPVVNALSQRMRTAATGGRQAPTGGINFTSGLPGQGAGNWGNPLVNAYGGPSGLQHAMSGGGDAWHNFTQSAYDARDAAARAGGQGVGNNAQNLQRTALNNRRQQMGMAPIDYSAGQQPGGTVGSWLDGVMGGGNIQTSVTPTNVYSTEQTQSAVSDAVANQHMGANLPWLQQRFARPGMSVSSPATAGAALPSYTSALAGAERARHDIPLADTTADAQHQLAGQTGRENEALDWGRIQSMVDAAQRDRNMSQITSLINMLGMFDGGNSGIPRQPK